MELKLTVLAGAKSGASIPLKKDEFTIGRSSDCTLRAGSDSISRRHCEITRSDDEWVVKDLGSRNGTLVNDQKITGPTLLKEGDELSVGPLKFRVDRREPKPATSEKNSAEKTTSKQPAKAPTSPGIKKSKQPPVKNVADVAARSAEQPGKFEFEEDISRWLIGEIPGAQATQETMNFRTEETTAINPTKSTTVFKEGELDEALAQQDQTASDSSGEGKEVPKDETNAEAGEASTNGGWKSFFGSKEKGEDKESAKPGKLPQVPEKDKSKDSREAASDVLREMTRRR